MPSTISHLAGRLAVTAGCFLLGATLPRVASGFYPESLERNETAAAAATAVPFDPRYVLPKLSTLGAGFEYRYRHSARVNFRAEWLTFEDTRTEASEELQSKVLLKLQSRALLFDWFPYEGRFRATLGIHFFNSSVTGAAYAEPLSFAGVNLSAAEVNSAVVGAADKLRLAGYAAYAAQLEQFAAANTQGLDLPASYTPGGSLAGAAAKLHSRPYAPYVGFGWANTENKRHGWLYSFDAGVIYLGRARVDYSVNGPLADAARQSYGADFGAWIEQEERETEDRLSKYRYFPVLSFGLSYRF
jgi:hypothetical protein